MAVVFVVGHHLGCQKIWVTNYYQMIRLHGILGAVGLGHIVGLMDS